MVPEQSMDSGIVLVADAKRITPEVSILGDRELRGELKRLKGKNGFHSVARFKFVGRKVRNAKNLVLEIASASNKTTDLSIQRDHRWYYIPLFGPMQDRFSFLCAQK